MTNRLQRRDLLHLLGAAALSPLAGCDRLVVLDPRGDRELMPITPIGTFYVYQYAGFPAFEPADHAIRIAHEDDVLLTIRPDDLARFEAIEREHTLQCIGHSPSIVRIGNAVWGGRPLVDILEDRGLDVPAEATSLRLEGMDDYYASVPVGDLRDAPIWLVWEMNGQPLPFEHGAPARLLVPGRYGVKNLKWLREVRFVDTPRGSYWTQFGWSEEAPYLPNTLVVNPLDGLVFEAGTKVGFAGSAFAGPDPVETVEVRVDDGSWEAAAVDYAPGPDVWALWSWVWEASPGEHTVQVRCTTASGARSVEDPRGTAVLLGYDGSMQIRVTVRSA